MIDWFRRKPQLARFLLVAGIVLTAGIALCLRIRLSPLWFTHPRFQAGLGKTIAECEAEYGRANFITSDPKFVCPHTRGYVKGGWSVMIGFDEAGKAEQFVYSIVGLGRSRELTQAEQSALLDGFKEGYVWEAAGDRGDGPAWHRTDGQAYAGYIASQRWLLIMNVHCLERHTAVNAARGGR